MRMLALVLSLSSVLTILSLATQVYAQGNTGSGSYHIDKNHLDKVTPYNAPRQIDILDTRPIIHNHLTPEQEPDTIEINVGMPAALPGKHEHVQIGNPSGSASAAPYRTGNPNLNSTIDLAPASQMFQSNIPARSSIKPNLAPGQLSGPHAHQAAPQAPAYERKSVAARLNSGQAKTPVPTMGYPIYSERKTSKAQTTVHKDVNGKLITPLKNWLLSK